MFTQIAQPGSFLHGHPLSGYNPWKEGLGWKKAQRQVDFINNFSIYIYMSQNILFDKHLHWLSVSVKNIQLNPFILMPMLVTLLFVSHIFFGNCLFY
jgi:hypothetical protein